MKPSKNTTFSANTLTYTKMTTSLVGIRAVQSLYGGHESKLRCL